MCYLQKNSAHLNKFTFDRGMITSFVSIVLNDVFDTIGTDEAVGSIKYKYLCTVCLLSDNTTLNYLTAITQIVTAKVSSKMF